MDDSVCDIEDLGKDEQGTDSNQPRAADRVVLPSRRRARVGSSQTQALGQQPDAPPPPDASSVIPGTQKVYVKTWGCSHNNRCCCPPRLTDPSSCSDGEYMSGQLAAFGYTVTSSADEADVWVLNGCTVKNPSQDTFTNAVRAGRSQGKHVVLAGCVSQGQPNHKDFRDHSVIGVGWAPCGTARANG